MLANPITSKTLKVKQMRKKVTLTMVTVVLTLYAAVVANGLASPTTSVAVDPLEVKDLQPGESFTVNLAVSEVVISESPISNGLYGWSVNVTFNPTILNVANVTEGPFLQQAAETVPLPARMDNTYGFAFAGAIIKPPFGLQGATGSGVLATLTFTVMGRGSTKLELKSLKLRTVVAGQNWEMTNITTIEGQFVNETSFPIELIAGIAGAAVIGGTLVAFFYRRRRAPTK